MDQTTFYKIRHKKTGLYSKGGVYVNAEGNNIFWNKSGKTWDKLSTLRSHITSHMPGSYNKGTDMSDWEVIEFVCTPTAIKSIHEVVNPKKLIELLKG
jgi:hypothetical protein